MIDQGSSRNFIWSILTARVLVQIGAFSHPAFRPSETVDHRVIVGRWPTKPNHSNAKMLLYAGP
jgi:hypothetical protein